MIEGQIVSDGVLDQRQYEAFRARLSKWKDVLIAKMLRATGIRVSELLRLEARHYSVSGPEFSILVKRKKSRSKKPQETYDRVYLPPILGVEIRDYIKGQHIGPSDRVFPQTVRALEYSFARAGIKGIGRAVRPHEMRHLYCKTLIDGGVPFPAAAKLLGHANPETTAKWYYDLTTEQRRAIGERMPI
ncbi:MAG: tyrosine-type recombinase/integrase [Candidatus Binatia bacterium]